jgi:hypothetical protein
MILKEHSYDIDHQLQTFSMTLHLQYIFVYLAILECVLSEPLLNGYFTLSGIKQANMDLARGLCLLLTAKQYIPSFWRL